MLYTESHTISVYSVFWSSLSEHDHNTEVDTEQEQESKIESLMKMNKKWIGLNILSERDTMRVRSA